MHDGQSRIGLRGSFSGYIVKNCRLDFNYRWYRIRNVTEKTRGIKVGKVRNANLKFNFKEELNEMLRESTEIY